MMLDDVLFHSTWVELLCGMGGENSCQQKGKGSARECDKELDVIVRRAANGDELVLQMSSPLRVSNLRTWFSKNWGCHLTFSSYLLGVLSYAILMTSLAM